MQSVKTGPKKCAKCGHEFNAGSIRKCPYSVKGAYVCRYCCRKCRYWLKDGIGEKCGYRKGEKI